MNPFLTYAKFILLFQILLNQSRHYLPKACECYLSALCHQQVAWQEDHPPPSLIQYLYMYNLFYYLPKKYKIVCRIFDCYLNIRYATMKQKGTSNFERIVSEGKRNDLPCNIKVDIHTLCNQSVTLFTGY